MTNMAKKYNGLKSECFPIAYSEYVMLDMCANRAHVSDQAIINLYHLNPADGKRLHKAIRKAVRKALRRITNSLKRKSITALSF